MRLYWIAIMAVLALPSAHAGLIEYQTGVHTLYTFGEERTERTDITFQYGFTVETTPIRPGGVMYAITDWWMNSSHFTLAVPIYRPHVYLKPYDSLFMMEVCCMGLDMGGVRYGLIPQAGEIFYDRLPPGGRQNPIRHLDRTSSLESRFYNYETQTADYMMISHAYSEASPIPPGSPPASVPAPTPLGLITAGLAVMALRCRFL